MNNKVSELIEKNLKQQIISHKIKLINWVKKMIILKQQNNSIGKAIEKGLEVIGTSSLFIAKAGTEVLSKAAGVATDIVLLLIFYE